MFWRRGSRNRESVVPGGRLRKAIISEMAVQRLAEQLEKTHESVQKHIIFCSINCPIYLCYL